jgi:hypothetical protein
LNGANDGFHEAIGDAVALSITPNYLVQIGLLDASKVPGADKDNGLLLRQAMDKVAFLPFGLLIDKWRWGVFNGSITPANYNRAGQTCDCSIRALSRLWSVQRIVSMPVQNIIFPVTRHIPAISSRGFCSSNSTRLRATFRAGKALFIVAHSTETRKWVRD